MAAVPIQKLGGEVAKAIGLDLQLVTRLELVFEPQRHPVVVAHCLLKDEQGQLAEVLRHYELHEKPSAEAADPAA